MGRPQGNGLIELVDEKSHDKGFFCMQLVSYIRRENAQTRTDMQDLWSQRFTEAKMGQCAYREHCPIHARTMAKRGNRPVQMTLDF